MKQALPWLIAAGCIGLALGVLLRGHSPSSMGVIPLDAQVTQPGVAPAQGAPLAPVEGTVVHTFEDEAKMNEFTNQWQERQAVRLRMAVLEGYWNNEQGALTQLSDQLNSQYNLDPSKNYFLDGEARVLREQELPAAAEGETASVPAEAEKGDVAYTFFDEEGMGAFTTLWQQRQGTNLRMTVLQAYWNQEQAQLAQLNSRFSANYSMDTTKNYFLDREQSVLIERPTPPASD